MFPLAPARQAIAQFSGTAPFWQGAEEWPHRSPPFRASQILWCALPFPVECSYISLFTWCQHIHNLFMRLWKLYLAERILELREMRTCDCDPWNSPEVTRRLMEIFQTWVFFLQDYDIEEIISHPRGMREEYKAENRVESPQAGFLASFLLPGF